MNRYKGKESWFYKNAGSKIYYIVELFDFET